MEPAKTIRIAYPANLRAGYANIPAAEFDPERHQIWGETARAPTSEGATLGKGPGGKWYIKTGKTVQAGPFATEEDARAALDAANAATPDGIPTPIPEEWEAMTDDELISLAGELIAGEVVVSGGGETQADKARSIILATVTDRAGK